MRPKLPIPDCGTLEGRPLRDCECATKTAHTLDEKKRLLNRVRRIMGQVAAIEKALDQEAECSDVLHNISACRGAMDALMAEVIGGHIRYHVLAPNGSGTDRMTLYAPRRGMAASRLIESSVEGISASAIDAVLRVCG
jgi:DNA-binding FrmR family transcriptional regulator